MQENSDKNSANVKMIKIKKLNKNGNIMENGVTSSKRERKETQKLKDYKTGLKTVNEVKSNRGKTKEEIRSKAKKTKEEKVKKDKEYIIESLLEKDGSKFLVKWENYSNSWNSWEPIKGIPPFILEVYIFRIRMKS